MSNGYPVTVAVERPDGSIEQVRVGTAFRSGDGFSLKLGDLTIGGQEAAAPQRAAPQRSAAPMGGGDGMVFPNYGRSKNAPIAGATVDDLEYYANGCRRTLNDPAKSRWHDKEKQLLAAIEAELARQGVAPSSGGARPRPSFAEERPASGGGSRGGGFDEPPPHTDEDIPF